MSTSSWLTLCSELISTVSEALPSVPETQTADELLDLLAHSETAGLRSRTETSMPAGEEAKPSPALGPSAAHLPSPRIPAIPVVSAFPFFLGSFSRAEVLAVSLRAASPSAPGPLFLPAPSRVIQCPPLLCVCRLHSALNPLNLAWEYPPKVPA